MKKNLNNSSLHHHPRYIPLTAGTHLDKIHARRHLGRHARAVAGLFHQSQALFGYRLSRGIDPLDISYAAQRKTSRRKAQMNRLTAAEGVGIDL